MVKLRRDCDQARAQARWRVQLLHQQSACAAQGCDGIFLGTGLGARAYAIIEQGMISRIIEAKPEELRVFLEEAAGVSKYRDRRRETELRIGDTRENLLRVSDILHELDKQLSTLASRPKWPNVTVSCRPDTIRRNVCCGC